MITNRFSIWLTLRLASGIFLLWLWPLPAWAQTAPTITQQPASQTVLAGSNLTLKVVTAGDGPFTYQWQFNGVNLPNGVISTVAGNGTSGYSGDGGEATNASLAGPTGVAVDRAGNLYMSTGNGPIPIIFNQSRIRKVDLNGIITTVAGIGMQGYFGDGGQATNAHLNGPAGVTLDASSNIFIADQFNNRVRKVDAKGIITTVAGNGSGGYSGDGGAATNASLAGPFEVTLDTYGNLFIADSGNNRIRKVDTSGIITTVAGNGVQGYSGDGGAATNASLNSAGAAVDAAGNLFIADPNNGRIRKVDTNGIITTVAGNGSQGYSGDGGAATNASLAGPFEVTLDTYGNLFIADSGNNRIRKVDTSGIITTVAGNGVRGYSGDGGAATNASLNNTVGGLAVDASGNVFIADQFNNRIRQVSFGGAPNLSLKGASAANAGDYQVIITSPYGSVTSAVATATVVSPPSILEQPKSVAVAAEGSATLKVDAAGTPPLSYAWYLNRTNLLQAGTNSTLSLASVSFAEAGGYTVVITNLFGSVTSVVANLSVGSAPTLISEPAGQTVLAGSNVSLEVVVAGTGPFTYQWQLDGTNIPNSLIITTAAGNGSRGYSGDGGAATNAGLNGPKGISVDSSGNLFIADQSNNRIRKVALADGPALQVESVSAVNGGEYQVIITSPYGSATSAIAIVTVLLPPSIITPPTNSAAAVGGTAVFNVHALGTPPFSYAWYFNGTNLLQAGTNSTLSLDHIGFAEAGGYTVVVTNLVGSVTSTVANLSVGFPPVITNQPASQIALAGTTNLTLTVGVSGSGPFSYSWLLNGVNLTNYLNQTNYLSSPVPTLKLSDVLAANGGAYQAIVTSPYGSVTSAVAIVTVLSPPFILTQPANAAVAVGGATTFGVVALGTQPLFYAWYFNGTNLVQAGTNSTLSLANASFTEAGNYRVVITNLFGSVSSSVADLLVGSPPLITSEPASQTALAGSNLKMKVVAGGTGPLSFRWQLNGLDISPNYPIITTVAGNGSSGYSGDGGSATNASFNQPSGAAVDTSGNLFIADQRNNRIRKVDANGIITTAAGSGLYGSPQSGGYSGDGGPATNATLWDPSGVAVDASGNLFIADQSNQRIRKVNANGIITTVAGDGSIGYSGDGGPATNANLNFPSGVAVDGSGNLFIVDWDNGRVRKVDTNGIISTVAGNGSKGNSGYGGVATNVGVYPIADAVDRFGNIFIADPAVSRIWKVDANGVMTSIAGIGNYVYSGDGGAAAIAGLSYPDGVAVDNSGDLFIADYNNHRIRKVDTSGIITTVAGGAQFPGNGGAPTNAYLAPSGVAVDAFGNLFIADLGNVVWQVTLSGFPALTLEGVSAVNAGGYRVIITSPYGSATSAVAAVTVALPPINAAFNVQGVALLTLNGAPGATYVLQSVESLAPPINWQSLVTNVSDLNGIWSFSDANTLKNPARFYRLRSP